jgi:hypothetical protein
MKFLFLKTLALFARKIAAWHHGYVIGAGIRIVWRKN